MVASRETEDRNRAIMLNSDVSAKIYPSPVISINRSYTFRA